MSQGPPRRRRRTDDWASAFRKQREQSRALLAALAVLAVVVGIVAVIGYRILLPSGNPVELPNFTGLSYDIAQHLAANSHVSLRVVAHHPDDRVAKQYVIGQFPAPGEHVREGRVVDVIVSDGPTLAVVPDLSSLSVRDAQVALGNVRLGLGGVTAERSDKVAEGRIIRQQPDAGSQVPAASKVDVIVAKGRSVAYVPNFVGLTLAFSQTAAKQAGVTLGAPLWLPIAKDARPKGIVIAQDPLPGQPLLSTDTIVLHVSSGPPPTPTPFPTVPPTEVPTSVPPTVAPESPSPPPASSSTPTAAPTARSLRIAVQLPAAKTPKRVRVALVDATGSRDLYDQVTAGGFTLSFDVTVTGAGTVQTYVDGALTTSTSL